MIAALAVLWLAACAPAQARQVAFVAGVNAYDNLGPDQQLRKAVNDSRAVAATLREIGFEVFSADGANRHGFLRVWQRFLDAIKPGDTAAFYFAGHGFEINGTNYLLPRDVARASDGEAALRGSALRVGELLDALKEQQPQVSIFIIDACRNNPFAGGTRAVGGSRGLKREEPPNGTLLMMSAGTGQEALDVLSATDTDANSVYTRTLIPLLRQPGLEITDLAKRVRSEVETLAATVQHRQRPSFYHELSGDFYLMPAQSAPPPVASVKVPAGAAQATAAPEATRPDGKLAALPVPASRNEAAAQAAPAPRPEAPLQAAAVATGLPQAGWVARAEPPRGAEAGAPARSAPFKDCAECPEMVTVPAGRYLMGPAADAGASPAEASRRAVTFAQPFAVGRFAVSQGEWSACVAGGGCQPRAEGWLSRRLPVVDVSDDDAKAYAAWLARTTGQPYRLLTEAEREYVGRAGATVSFGWGGAISLAPDNDGAAAYASAGKVELARPKSPPVDGYPPNPWGRHQVPGNVSERVEDCLRPSRDDASVSARLGLPCERRVLPDGSWFDLPQRLRAASRDPAAPATIGFRVARGL